MTVATSPVIAPVAPPVADTRARILEVALELFVEQGYAATSTRELSERLGFTKAALYYHFRTKDELLGALIAPAIDELTRLTSDAELKSSSAARRTVLTLYVDYVSTHRDLIKVITQDPAVARGQSLGDPRALYQRLTQLLSGSEAPSPAERTRVRAALGAVRAALLHTEPGSEAGEVRAVTLAAACGALGIPAPRTGGAPPA